MRPKFTHHGGGCQQETRHGVTTHLILHPFPSAPGGGFDVDQRLRSQRRHVAQGTELVA